jgi:hypothetical protein
MVYFIQGEQTKRIKIGKADDVLARLKGLQCGSPDRLTVLKVLTTEGRDRKYHSQFQEDLVYGEWFSPSDTLMAFIESIPESKFDGLTYLPGERKPVKLATDRASREYPTHDASQPIHLSDRLMHVSGLKAYLQRTSMSTNAW